MIPPSDDGGIEDEEDAEEGDDDTDDDVELVDLATEADEPEPDEDIEVYEIGVLPDNRVIVETFDRCLPELSVGMGVLWQGVRATEIRAACGMGRVPRKVWPAVIDGVQLMARIVAGIRNDDEAARAEARKNQKS